MANCYQIVTRVTIWQPMVPWPRRREAGPATTPKDVVRLREISTTGPDMEQGRAPVMHRPHFNEVDLAGRYSNRADLQKLEATRAAIDSGSASKPRRRRRTALPAEPTRTPRLLKRRLPRATIEELIQAYRAGASTAELARRYSTSKTAILDLLTKRGIPRRVRPRSPARTQQSRVGHPIRPVGFTPHSYRPAMGSNTDTKQLARRDLHADRDHTTRGERAGRSRRSLSPLPATSSECLCKRRDCRYFGPLDGMDLVRTEISGHNLPYSSPHVSATMHRLCPTRTAGAASYRMGPEPMHRRSSRMRTIVAAVVIAAGVMAGAAGVASANDPIPGPNAVGPFTDHGAFTGRAICESDMEARGYVSGCYRYDIVYQSPQSTGQWFYDKLGQDK